MPKDSIGPIRAAIGYVEAHLSEPLDLDRVAGAVHYSKYHLHRTFSALTGLTLHDYIQRRRLTEAANLLVFSDKPILDLALLAGYESQQAFTDVFTAMYKQSPNKYRENEEFYPLQLKFEFGECRPMPTAQPSHLWKITFAAEADIPDWMELVRLAVDGFPRLNEEDYLQTLRARIAAGRALIMRDGGAAIGVLLFSPETGSIEFMATHPLYRRRGVPRAFLDKLLGGLIPDKALSTTTYRAGDRADTGHRRALLELGFAEAELLVEFGYPTQRFVLPREDSHE